MANDTVVTPAKNSRPRDKLQQKSSCDKTYQMHGAKRAANVSGIQQRSTNKNDFSSNYKDDSRYVKSIDSHHMDSQSRSKRNFHRISTAKHDNYVRGNSADDTKAV